MKDIISKATFGFLMAQAFPGAVAVFALAFAYFAFERRFPHTSLLDAADRLLQVWGTATVPHQIFLLALCIGAGMSIHGVHWATLGALEHQKKIDGSGMTIFESKWHQWLIAIQVVLGAPLLLWETTRLFSMRGIKETSIDENVAYIKKDDTYSHEFLQEFYLYSAQFFAHTAYALIVVIVATCIYMARYGVTARRLILTLVAYLLVGIFYVLARFQLATLFAGERNLIKRGELRSLAAD